MRNIWTTQRLRCDGFTVAFKQRPSGKIVVQSITRSRPKEKRDRPVEKIVDALKSNGSNVVELPFLLNR